MSSVEKQTIDQLTERYGQLNHQKIRAETNLAAATDRLNELKAEAKEEFGTDDIKLLKKKLEEIENENERLRSDYQSALDKIESDLKKVQANYDDPVDDEADNENVENAAADVAEVEQDVDCLEIEKIEDKPF